MELENRCAEIELKRKKDAGAGQVASELEKLATAAGLLFGVEAALLERVGPALAPDAGDEDCKLRVLDHPRVPLAHQIRDARRDIEDASLRIHKTISRIEL